MTRLLAATVLVVMPVFPAAQHLIEGLAQSPVRVIVYEDLQCPDCADFRVMLDEKLLPRFASTVRFEHRDFPLAKHAWARKAAIAARFFDRSEATKTFKRGMDAHNNPGFYRQLGKDPDLLLSAALELLARKFSL